MTTDIDPASATAEAPPAIKPGQRLESVDLVRGLVMVVMVLDHTRDFVGDLSQNPTNLATTTTALFFTRWVTHFCAPVFVFLAGTGAYLAGSRGKTRGELARFLFTRGLWLIFLEVTVIRFGLTFDPKFSFIPLTVIWAIGLSMVVLSALIFLPLPAIAAFGLILIFGHNALDRFDASLAQSYGPLWSVLHTRGPLASIDGHLFFILYPLVPWVGVMAVGYALGAVFKLERRARLTWLYGLGFGLIALFVALRWSNLYGNPTPWTVQDRPGFTLLSFLNCEKYPPSLLYLCMTLGPALVALALADRGAGRLTRPLVTLGRVPLFYYILQWYLLHLLALPIAYLSGQPALWLVGNGPFEPPPGYGHGLPFVYAMWAVSVFLLYWPSAWFADLKQRRRRDVWLSYF